jgi:integrase
MFAIAAMAGLRAGEILGLQVGDFDFPGRVLHVRRSVWRGKLQTTKSVHSETMFPMPDALASIVKEHVLSLKPEQEFLFLNSRGSLFIAENARITLGIYGHIIGDAHREAVDKVASILASNGLESEPQTKMLQ